MIVNNICSRFFYGLCVIGMLCSCESFVEVDVPSDRITGETVFNDDKTALSALEGLYTQLFNTSFAAGGNRSVTFLAGLSGDNFAITTSTEEMVEFADYEISPSNSFNLDLWSGAYSTIYMANTLLEGVENFSGLTEESRNRILGEAKFIRAFTYFYLVNLYNEIPLILTTDYNNNALASNATTEEINLQIIADLNEALELVGSEYPDDQRTYVNSYAIMALLARVYLFQENWQQAEFYSTQVISAGNMYQLLDDPNQVFLANSQEAIWQISPAGWGGSFRHTREGNLFVRISSGSSPVEISEDLMALWEEGDQRFTYWVGTYSDDTGSYFYPNKYKIQYDASGGDIMEYSMVLRLAEQFLIRAEARARMDDIDGAVADIDIIRERAEIPLISETRPGISSSQLIDLILLEKRREFFAEWGHRWLDLKRTDSAGEVLNNEPLWEPTDVFYPIPEQERMKNPNLEQNEGY
ncbi:RagB/SusD family nutrient uptake outer membrane protein [Zunongwangia sp. F363]|uniref:RagB/SusD family nutrient uptake outer membrane protein n=1 Tax=Autumnicola tepida TaxID=3075595 RepID=A0ABU3CDY8_9FLAO|nr:RagB/SusD family nutrient uptake outer membrane protein [Zunongwangia sp. F363]MDT0644516.1 RagB/SusD family nutrient uptake outer membrane protein [Zunongwangia sp. F363]